MLFLLPACVALTDGTADDGETAGLPETSSSLPGVETIVPVDDLEVFVTADEGYWITDVGDLDDLDDDGVLDMLMGVSDSSRYFTTSFVLVRGPLLDVHVPSDAWAEFDAANVRLLEVTGDDTLDLVVTSHPEDLDPGLWLGPRPYDGSSVGDVGWTNLGSQLVDSLLADVDDDGTADRLESNLSPVDGVSVLVTWGPSDRWAGNPDVTIAPNCRNGPFHYFYSAVYWDDAKLPGDLDDDGTAELTMEPWGGAYGFDCGDFTVSLASGKIDPFTSPFGLDRMSRTLEAIGDWDGDLASEVWSPDDGTVQVSPVLLDASGAHGTSVVAADESIDDLVLLPFDLGSDGVADVLARLQGNVMVVLPTDLAQLTSLHATVGVDVLASDARFTYLDDGHAWLGVRDSTAQFTIRRFDLGPATAL